MLALVLTLSLAGADATEAWVEANRAFRQNDFATAVTRYEELLVAGYDGADLHYNLGNAQLREGHLGRAIASYLAASARAPRDEDVRGNLGFARKASKDAVAPPEASAVLRTLFFWHYALSQRELVFALAAASLAFWTALFIWRLRRRSAVWRVVALGLLAVLVLLGPSAATRALSPSIIAVVVSPEVDVHAGIGDAAVTRFRLHAGAEARVLDRQEGWARLELSDGKQGWVADSHVAFVAM